MSAWATIVTGALIGSVTGIGGAVIGSWMTGKSQIAALRINLSAEDARAKLDEKRRMYV
jgi:hypothetical protein